MVLDHKPDFSTNREDCSLTESKRAIKYLGVMIDDRLTFTAHIDYAFKSGNSNSSPLVGQVEQLSVPLQKRNGPGERDLVNFAVGSGSLESSLEQEVYSVAADVVAGVMPISVLLEEDIFCYEHRNMPGVRKHAREASMSY
ncbi:uncharacterized protein LOC129746665 [Uranotaenia lowii]|uniref:uncharacterized protein LOC129746665 n=1 Tax=Uranotaenia lowii TaxID=190385 RepID=UPI0024787469|nr:uncharacterized protein LOC129746665 [Uranotaenia lowii]